MKILSFSVSFSLVTCLFASLGQAKCPTGDQVHLPLGADQFALSAYDVRQGLLAIKALSRTYHGANNVDGIQVDLPAKPFFVSVGPQRLRWLLERGISQVEVELNAVRTRPVVSGPVRPSCGRWSLHSVRLKKDGIVVAQHRLEPSEVIRPRHSLTTKLAVERGNVSKSEVLALSKRLSSNCRGLASRNGQLVQGAVSVQLDRDLLGRPQPPQIVVDGLVNPQISHCLNTRLFASKSLWAAIDPSSRLYLTFYFRARTQP